VQEGAPGAPGTVDHFLGEHLEIVAVIGLLIALHVDDARPAAAQADHLVALAQGAHGHSTDGRVEAWHIATTRQDTDHPLCLL
jgi:hypothetical protein